MPKVPEEIKEVQEKAKKLGVPFFDLTGQTIQPEVLKEVSEEAASFYQFVPIGKKDDTLEIGMLNPDDLKSQEAIKFIAQSRNFTPKIFLITQTDFENVLNQYRTLKEEVETALSELEKELAIKDSARGKEQKTQTEAMLERVMTEAPITKIVAVILRHALENRASDVHIEPIEEKVKVRFRVDGALYTGLVLPKAIQSAVASRIKILSNLKIDEIRVPQDGRFHSVIDNKKIDFRVSTFPTSFGEKVVLRLLDSSIGLMTFEKLGLEGHNLRMMREAINKPFGMILITGPTGSGKSTTLYAILQEMNEESVNIVSLEDPVEYNIEGVNQSQTKPEIGYTFASGLRSILRQDPDIIMVGEIRDSETANLATHAALTGHIVLSTLHTNDAIGVVPRLMDMGVEAFLIPSSLNLSIAQRLLRRLCPDCKKAVEAPPRAKAIIQKEIDEFSDDMKSDLKDLDLKNIKIWQAPGCEFCAQKGTKGRVAIFEALAMTPELEKIVVGEPTESKIREEAERQNMVSLRQDGIVKVLRGVISFQEFIEAVEGELKEEEEIKIKEPIVQAKK